MKTWPTKKPVVRRPARDYGPRGYGNPLFAARTIRQRGRGPSDFGRRLTFYAVITLPLLVVAALGWYFLFGPAFRIETVELVGASPEAEALVRAAVETRLAGRRFLVLPQSNIFVFSSTQAEKNVARVLALDRLEFRKKLPHGLVIELAEKPLAAIYLSDNHFFGLAGDGTIIRDLSERELRRLRDLPPDVQAVNVPELGAESVAVPAPEGDADPIGPGLPLIRDGEEGSEGRRTPVPGDLVVEAAPLAFIRQAQTDLAATAGGRPLWFTVKPAAETIEVALEGSWRIFFTTATSYEVQTGRLAIVLKDKIGDKKAQLEYVDLRYDERIFFRLKTTPVPAKE